MTVEILQGCDALAARDATADASIKTPVGARGNSGKPHIPMPPRRPSEKATGPAGAVRQRLIVHRSIVVMQCRIDVGGDCPFRCHSPHITHLRKIA